MPLDSFFKLSAEDPESKCNVITPLNPSDLDREINPRTGRVITKDDQDAAKRAFTRIAHARGAMVGVCCDPSSNYRNHDSKILDDLRKKYPSVRLIKDNAGVITEIELSRVKKPVAKGWRQISPYLVCRIMNATMRDDPDDTDVVRATNLTKDCYTENCDTTDGLTLEALFGSMPDAELEYTAYDDARVARAIAGGDVTYVKEYLRKYNKVDQPLTHNDYRERILHLAVRAGYSQKRHIEVLDLVLAVRPRLDVRNHRGNTPMHVAVASGQVDAVERLIKYGGSTKAGVNTKNNRGETPIMIAVSYHNPTHEQDTIDGRTPAVFASMARLLYNNGANIMETDNYGNNILHHIILNSPDVYDKSRLIRYFIERGANGEQPNSDGITPLGLTGDLLGDYKDIEPLPERPSDEGKWITHELPQKMSKSATFPTKSKEGFRSQPPTPRHNSALPPSVEFKTDLRSEVNSDPRREQLLAIQTMLFNDHIRQHPEKYNHPVNVSEIPRGAPVVVQHYMCSADGSSDNPSSQLFELDTREECEAHGAHWIKIKKPTTMVQLSIIPEGDSHIDDVPQDELYHDKFPKSEIYKPLPDEIQKINSEVRNSSNSQLNSMSRQAFTDNVLSQPGRGNTYTSDGREGFEDMNGEYVSRGPIPNLLSSSNGSNGSGTIIDTMGLSLHPEVCRGIKVNAEAHNARIQANKLLANNFKDSSGIRRLGQFVHDNYMLVLVLLLLIVIFLWQLSKCHI